MCDNGLFQHGPVLNFKTLKQKSKNLTKSEVLKDLKTVQIYRETPFR